MRYPLKADRYLTRYAQVPRDLAKSYDPDDADEVIAAIINREALQGDPRFVEQLVTLDAEVARAINAALPEWSQALSPLGRPDEVGA